MGDHTRGRVVASQSTRLRMKERENKTIVNFSGHYQPSPARMASRPSLVFPRYLLGRVAPAAHTQVRMPQKWPPNAGLSIKNRFMVLDSHFDMRVRCINARDVDASINWNHRPPTIGDRLDAKIQDQVKATRKPLRGMRMKFNLMAPDRS
jgi:hypothetical protein